MTAQNAGGEHTARTPSTKRKRIKSWVILFLGLVGFLAIPIASRGLANYCSRQGYESIRQEVGVNPSGTLYIIGAIDGNLSRMLHETIAGAKTPIKRIRLHSIGGLAVDADKMGKELKGLPGAPLTEVPDRGTCQSACINLLAEAPGELRIAPTATLMFHAGARRIGLASCGVCGVLNSVMVAFSSAIQTTDEAHALLPAARRLSDKIPVLFGLCKINPLDSQAGITLYGSDFDGLRNGSITPADLAKWCPSS